MDETGYSEIGVKGKYVRVRSLRIGGLTVVVKGRLLRKAYLLEEDHADIGDPEALIEALRASRLKADIFTFKQRFPDVSPRFAYPRETLEIAVLPVTSLEVWLNDQVSQNTKRAVAKAAKSGLQVRRASFDRTFAEGMKAIFDESPTRQGKPFWHYGKDLATVEEEFSRFLFREDIVGAYWRDRLVGFLFLTRTGRYAMPTQILASLEHRDKGVANALLAKAVEICVERGIPYLIYGTWQEGGLTEFKRRNGFVRAEVPRYHVPLTVKGAAAVRLRLHRGWARALPAPLKRFLLDLRARWSGRRALGG
jgi:GNAT superfamily N-acetyltransferase